MQNSPNFLPRKEMLELLVRVIGTSSGKIQQLAQDTILQLGMASSGMGGMSKLPVFSDQNLVQLQNKKPLRALST